MSPLQASRPAAPLRWLLGLCAAGVVTLLLLRAMQALVTGGEAQLMTDMSRFTLDFVRVEAIPEPVRQERRRAERPPPPKPSPPPPAAPSLAMPKPVVGRLSITPQRFDIDISLTADGFSIGDAEGEFLPIVKVAPIYPRRALSRGIEGECLVEYTVTETGTTRDVRVIESQCTSRLFHSASLRAAQKFRYKPRIRDGRPVEVPGVRNLFRYKIE